jgi:hypothetical protein
MLPVQVVLIYNVLNYGSITASFQHMIFFSAYVSQLSVDVGWFSRTMPHAARGAKQAVVLANHVVLCLALSLKPGLICSALY